MQLLFNRVCMLFLSLPDAGRVAPIRGSVLGSVLWGRLALEQALE